MKLKKTWIGSALCGIALLILVGIGTAGPRYTDDAKFVSIDSTIGKSAEEIVAEIGSPERKGSCHVPLNATKPRAARVAGEDWAYSYTDSRNQYFLYLCIVKGTVTAEYRIAKTLRDNVSFSREEIVIDYGLAAMLAKSQQGTISE